MEESEKVLQRIIDLLVAAGYVRAQATSLPPFDKLTGGLAWCITACDVDVDIDLFYDDNATLEHKLRNRGRLQCFQEGGMSQNDDPVGASMRAQEPPGLLQISVKSGANPGAVRK
ncbi:hypothetical protein L7F22_036561 [Adiantum nelumboides]|nr:hypothetical protein [Adiantum nelumboides]